MAGTLDLVATALVVINAALLILNSFMYFRMRKVTRQRIDAYHELIAVIGSKKP